MKLSRLLTIYVTLFVVILSVTLCIVVYYGVNTITKEIHDVHITRAIDGIENELKVYLESRRMSLSDIAKLPIVVQTVMMPEVNKPAMDDYINSITIFEQKGNIHLYSYDGVQVSSTGADSMPISQDICGEVITNKEYKILISSRYNVYFWDIYVPVIYNGYGEGVLVGKFPVYEFSQYHDLKDRLERMSLVVRAENGVVAGTFGKTIDGIKASRALPNFNCSLEFVFDSDSSDIVYTLISRLLMVLVVITLIAEGVLLYLLKKFIIKPLNMFKAQARSVANNETFTEGAASNIHEFNELSSKLHIMVNKIRQREKELRNSHEELENTHIRLQKNQRTMIRQEKLASLGQLSAGVAHEINNPIGYIMGNSEALLDYFSSIEELLNIYECNLESEFVKGEREKVDADFIFENVVPLLKDNLAGVETVANIVSNLKNFSAVGARDNFTIANLNESLKSTLLVANNEIKYIAEVTCEYGDIEPIHCNPGEINQVFLNLIINSAHAIKKAMRSNGMILVKTYMEEDWVCVLIQDNGCGIEKENIDRIYDPFFTTKDVGEGTGLGLNISYDIIVNRHSGRIDVDSIINESTTFIVKIPIELKTCKIVS